MPLFPYFCLLSSQQNVILYFIYLFIFHPTRSWAAPCSLHPQTSTGREWGAWWRPYRRRPEVPIRPVTSCILPPHNLHQTQHRLTQLALQIHMPPWVSDNGREKLQARFAPHYISSENHLCVLDVCIPLKEAPRTTQVSCRASAPLRKTKGVECIRQADWLTHAHARSSPCPHAHTFTFHSPQRFSWFHFQFCFQWETGRITVDKLKRNTEIKIAVNVSTIIHTEHDFRVKLCLKKCLCHTCFLITVHNPLTLVIRRVGDVFLCVSDFVLKWGRCSSDKPHYPAVSSAFCSAFFCLQPRCQARLLFQGVWSFKF